jgi:hypothetical protein
MKQARPKSVVSSTEITAFTGGPAKSGTHNLFVIDSGGTSRAGVKDHFTYEQRQHGSS